MLILPAIDLRRGKCVRLYQGRPDQETVYSDDPLSVAKLWRMKGAAMLHIADLDGAFAGKPINLPMVAHIRREVGIPIQLGGGFRDFESIERALSQGIDKIILGTVAVQSPDLVMQAVDEFGPAIAVSVDAADSFAAISGWKELSAVRFDVLAQRMREIGVQELVFTDTHKDGTLAGPNMDAIRLFLSVAQVPVTVSGGVSCLEDLTELKDFEPLGLKAVIIGKALYDLKIDLEAAIRVAGS
jgi:phosphoribosylformimino-5-aminoimidazole carboxamide ribotide isomerase